MVHSIVSIKTKLEDRGIKCMLLGYDQNHMSGTYHMFNLCMKHVVLIRDVMWINKISVCYVSIKLHTKSDTYILQD